MLLLQRCESVDERVFYMQEAARNQWSVDVLRYHIASDLFSKRHGRANNFGTALPAPLRKHAAEAFKDEYLLDFISMDDSSGEAALEGALVKNLREFLMSLGREFAFMGNQYRIVVDEEEFFVDLLFYHRQLRSLVAVDLKVGRFRPEYAGKMNFYLEALDRHVKLPHENPSIGIILCREKRNTIVEYAFKRIDRPMGVATYALDGNLPPQFRGYLPSPDQLKMVADKGLAPGTIDHTCAASLNRPRRKKRNRTSARSQS
jgi:predicted nuclease of restriction endonuclease-like (RecB) superfamily